MAAPVSEQDQVSQLFQDGATEKYSIAMVDTIFADTLSRGMQNAITSQQNAQMASSASITNACARILQAKASAEGVTGQIPVKPRQKEAIIQPEPLYSESLSDPEETVVADAKPTSNKSGLKPEKRWLLPAVAAGSIAITVIGIVYYLGFFAAS